MPGHRLRHPLLAYRPSALDLEVQVDLVADHAERRLHAEVAALDGCTAAEADDMALVPGVLTFLIEDDVNVTGCVTPAMVRSPRIVPVLSPVLVNSVPTKVMSGNSVALNQSAPCMSLSLCALFVEMLDTFRATLSELASGLAASKSNVPEKSLTVPMTLEKPR